MFVTFYSHTWVFALFVKDLVLFVGVHHKYISESCLEYTVDLMKSLLQILFISQIPCLVTMSVFYFRSFQPWDRQKLFHVSLAWNLPQVSERRLRDHNGRRIWALVRCLELFQCIDWCLMIKIGFIQNISLRNFRK